MIYIYNQKVTAKKQIGLVKPFIDKKILAFSPHSDDISISAGGFISSLASQNEIVPVLGFTGWRGISSKLTRAEAVKIREDEMKKEAKVLGISAPVFLHLACYDSDDKKGIQSDEQKIQQLIRQQQPDIIFLPSRTDLQPRHQLLTGIIMSALKKIKLPALLLFYETPWSMFGPKDINFLVPLAEEDMHKKILAVSVHSSQLERTDFVNIAKCTLMLRAQVVPEQLIGGYGSSINLGQWLEVFNCVKIDK